MKVLITDDGPGGAHSYHRYECARVFQYCGHDVVIFNVSRPANEIFDTFKPDLFWGQTYHLSNQMVDRLNEIQPYTILRAFDWGDNKKEVKKAEEKLGKGYFKIEFAKPNHVKMVEKLKRIDYVFNHYAPDKIMHCLGNWTNVCPVKSNMLGCCVWNYCGGKFMPELESDVSFIGSWHDYKKINLVPWLHNLRYHDVKCKFFSTWAWPKPFFMGQIPPEMNKHVYKSAKITPNISEPHSTTFGTDVIERLFATTGAGSFCISDYVESATEIFGEGVVFAKTADEFHKLVKQYLNEPEERARIAKIGNEITLSSHTYFHRVRDIFLNLGLDKEADNVMSKYKEFYVHSAR